MPYCVLLLVFAMRKAYSLSNAVMCVYRADVLREAQVLLLFIISQILMHAMHQRDK